MVENINPAEPRLASAPKHNVPTVGDAAPPTNGLTPSVTPAADTPASQMTVPDDVAILISDDSFSR